MLNRIGLVAIVSLFVGLGCGGPPESDPVEVEATALVSQPPQWVCEDQSTYNRNLCKGFGSNQAACNAVCYDYCFYTTTTKCNLTK